MTEPDTASKLIKRTNCTSGSTDFPLDDCMDVDVAQEEKGSAGGAGGDKEHEALLDEDDLSKKLLELPDWKKQITLRGAVVGLGLGLLFCIITMRLALGSAGIVPSLNVPGGLLSFVALKGVSAAGQRCNMKRGLFAPFGIQENTVVQTMVSACYGIAFSGGFGMYLTGMGYQAYLNTGGVPEGQPGFNPDVVFNPVNSRVIPYLLLISVVGVFTLTALRKLMIIDWRLPFPSGTATGIMLTSFHSDSGEAQAMRKVKIMGWASLGSFIFDFWKWFFQGSDYGCGFSVFPTFGLEAAKWRWQFDFAINYVGSGMICPHIVNWSMMLGAIISWGIMWPVFSTKAGIWYPAGLGPYDFKGLFGYKMFLTIAMIMGEGIYMLFRVLFTASRDIHKRYRAARLARGESAAALAAGSTSDLKPPAARSASSRLSRINSEASAIISASHGSTTMDSLLTFRETKRERQWRTVVFLADSIPWWISPVGYLVFAVAGIAGIPFLYPPVKWYYVLVAFLMAPLMALPNSYGCGLTDWDNCSMYGKLALFAFAAWAGAENNGVIAGLGICGVILSATSSAAILMQDFRTGYLTTSSPRAMFASQIIGSIMGCFLAPLAFSLFYKTGAVGVPGGAYPNPFATIYRSMAILGTEGFGALPQYCTLMMGCFFAGAMIICGVRDALPPRYARFVPSPMAMGIPFYIGANSAIDFWLGSLIMHVWEWVDRSGAEQYGTVVGAGLLIGDGVWAIPSAILAVAEVLPPICMQFWNGGSEMMPS